MTTEPRQEAGWLVRELLNADRRTTEGDGHANLARQYDRFVDALAAAIEETEAEDAVERLRNNPRRHGKGAATTRLTNARAARRAALSALREDGNG